MILEALLISSKSSDAWSTGIFDPKTSHQIFSYKGSELQGNSAAEAIAIGNEFLLLPIVGKPIVITIGLQHWGRTIQRSVFPSSPNSVAVSNCGSIAIGAIDEAIYCWFLSSGQLVSVHRSAHYQPITKLKFAAADHSLVVTAGKDGLVQVWNLNDLLAKSQQDRFGKGENVIFSDCLLLEDSLLIVFLLIKNFFSKYSRFIKDTKFIGFITFVSVICSKAPLSLEV